MGQVRVKTGRWEMEIIGTLGHQEKTEKIEDNRVEKDSLEENRSTLATDFGKGLGTNIPEN